MTSPAPPAPTALHFAQYDIYAKICLIQRTAKVYAVNTKFDVDKYLIMGFQIGF
jgi:hypothetical protein